MAWSTITKKVEIGYLMSQNSNSFNEIITRGYCGGALSAELTDKIIASGVLTTCREYALDNAKPVFLTTTQATIAKPIAKVTDDKRRFMCYFKDTTQLQESDKLDKSVTAIINEVIDEVYGHNVFKKSKLSKMNAATSIMYSIPCGSVTYADQDVRCQCEPKGNSKLKSKGCVCTDQLTHTDYADYSLEAISEDQGPSKGIMNTFYGGTGSDNTEIAPIEHLPMIALIALQDNTSLGFLPHSHVRPLPTDNKGRRKYNARANLSLKQGEYVILHPLLIHFGVQYGEENIRLHVYMDSELCQRPHDEKGLPLTYPVHVRGAFGAYKSGCDIVKPANDTKEKAKAKKRSVGLNLALARKRKATEKKQEKESQRVKEVNETMQAANELLSMKMAV